MEESSQFRKIIVLGGVISWLGHCHVTRFLRAAAAAADELRPPSGCC